MNPCPDWRDALEDDALGLPASSALQAHVAGCAACAAALAALRAQAKQLDAGVRQVVAAEPAPALPARLLAKIKVGSASFPWVYHWKPALVCVVLAAGIGMSVYIVREAGETREQQVILSSAAAALSHWHSPTDILLQSPADPLLKTVPRLGESFFELERPVNASTPKKGGKDAS